MSLKKMKPSKIFTGALFAVVFSAVLFSIFSPGSFPLHDQFNMLVLFGSIMLLSVLAFFFEFEDRASTSRELSLVASLGGLSAISRVVFAALPSFQPATFLVLCSGYVFGSLAGFMVGALTAIISNLFLGHGPWTLFQIFAWGMGGAAIGLLKGRRLNRYYLALLGAVWAYVFGILMNLWFLSGMPVVSLKSIISAQMVSLWMDMIHVSATVLFMLIFGERVIKTLERFRARSETVFQRPSSK